MNKRTMHNECFSCKFRADIPGNCHIRCTNPDPKMTGHQHGINKGWFMYPFNFDPVWKIAMCRNFEEKDNESA